MLTFGVTFTLAQLISCLLITSVYVISAYQIYYQSQWLTNLTTKKSSNVITFLMSISNALSKQRFSLEIAEVLILVADTQNLQSTHLLVREAYL